VIDGPIGAELLEKVTASPARLVGLGWMDAGTRNVYTSKPITKPADLKGLKMRTMGNPLFVETMNAMGGNGVPLGYNELYSALQTKVVDGAENNPPSMLTANHYQVVKVYSLTGHLIIPEMFVFSKASWDKLSKEDQALLKKHSREAQMRKVIDGPIGVEILNKLTNSSARLVGLGWMDAGTRNVYSDKPVTKPADLKGMKIRMMGNPLFVETMNAMGGNGIAMGFNELHQALQSGVVDGAENNEPTLFAQNHYQTPKGKVYSLTGHLIIPEIFVYSKASWDKLPKADQDLIKKLSREAQLEQRKLWDAYVAEATGKLKAAGVKFVPADKEAFYKATQPVRDKYGAKYATLIQRIRDTK
jgi:TRAP-type C4-dicarboxylate transport system substrate-binding protein